MNEINILEILRSSFTLVLLIGCSILSFTFAIERCLYFSTVVGIIKAFRDLALSGVGGPAVVAKGIAEALVATAAGLAVAIPAVIVYNYYMRKVKTITATMEAASIEIVISLHS